MRTIKLTIEYDGTNFHGWQVQKRLYRTVQGELEKACKRIFKENIRPIGAGRTDSGVHALGQVAHFKTQSKIPTEKIIKALNAHLIDDMAILDARDMRDKDFHAQYSAKQKTYRYTILNRATRCAQLKNFCYFYPYALNIQRMRKEVNSLIGKHNFASFQAADPALRRKQKIKNTVRTIKKISIRKHNDIIIIDITGDGFLYKMVRNIVGTLLEIEKSALKGKKISMKQIMAKRDRKLAGATANARGLCLLKVKY